MDAQQMHDEETKGFKLSPGSRGRLEALLKAKEKASSETGQSKASGSLDALLRARPTLSLEKALKEIEDAGF